MTAPPVPGPAIGPAAGDTVRETTRGAVRVLTVDRAKKKNALDRATIERIAAGIERASADPAVRGVVLAAAGDVFLAGGDLAELSTLPRTVEGADAVLAMGERLDAIEASEVPIIAAIAGDVYGGGCEVVLACDDAIAEPHVRFAFRHAVMGLCPAWGGTARLVERIGSAHASRVLFGAEPFDAEHAYRIGFVSEIASTGDAVERAIARIAAIARADRAVIAEQRRLVRATAAALPGVSGRTAARDLESAAFRRLWGAAAHAAAMDRFAADSDRRKTRS